MDNWEDMHNNQKLEALARIVAAVGGKTHINDHISDLNTAEAKAADQAAKKPKG